MALPSVNVNKICFMQSLVFGWVIQCLFKCFVPCFKIRNMLVHLLFATYFEQIAHFDICVNVPYECALTLLKMLNFMLQNF